MSDESSRTTPDAGTTDPVLAAHASAVTPAEAELIRENLDEIKARVASALARSGRTADDVDILLATKTQTPEKILVALEHGFTLIGENRVQELTAKAEALAVVEHETHLIGPLQKNKVNHTLRVASCIQSIDSVSLAEKIQNRLEALDATVEYFVQVNTSRESSKSGVAPEDAEALIESLRGLDRMRMRGFMTIGLPGSTPAEIRPSYADLRELRDRLVSTGVVAADARELSMGMSNDYELAIEEGATMVRVGSSVFGSRPKP